MRTAGLLLFVVAILFQFLSSCKKEPVRVIDFSTITATDVNCNVTGAADSTDWTNDTLFTKQELALLNFVDTNVKVSDTLTGRVYVAPVCANPNNGKFTQQMITAKECKFKMVCVNTNMQILYYRILRLPGGESVQSYNFSGLTAFHRGEYYRMYYGFFNSRDSLYYKGHGDIRID